MSKKMLIDATHAEETRVVVVDGNKVEDFDFESVNKRQLAGNIYLAKVTRVEPSLQAAFVEYGGNRHGFLAFSEIHPDYYQIPQADRKALLEEEARAARDADAEEDEKPKPRGRSRRQPQKRGDASVGQDAANDEPAALALEDGAPAQADETISEVAAGDEDVTAQNIHEPEDEDGGDATHPQLVETPEGRSRGGRSGGRSAAETNDAEYETVGADDVSEEVAPRRAPRLRRYKIQEVVKVRQIMLIQVVKEERGNKGAAVTTYLSLAGRYCVLMPNTARGGGISRKITNISDRKKLKEIAAEIQVPAGAGLIIRTAGSQRTKAEIKRDYEYLLRQWEQIRDLTLKSMAPAPIYEEGSLIKRSIRDLYNRDIDEIWVDGEAGYREAKDYMKMLMPSHSKNVKKYEESLPLFARYQVENYLSAMFNPTVQLKSGGYIVIGITEALVAIDVNSGRSTREGSIEDTALKTNLEAAEEVAHQLKLRDLAGLIVIDFIDMEDRRNNLAVEKRMKDKLKHDRARIQVGRISGFGLMEMSRQRLRPGMIEASTQPCPHCHGTGITRSNDSMALAILRELEEEGVRKRAREVLVSAPVEVANYLLNAKREHVTTIETRFGLSVRIEADPSLISPEYRLERFKTTTRPVPEVETVSFTSVAAADVEEEEVEDEVRATPPTTPPAAATDEDTLPKKRRRRRRRGGKGRTEEENGNPAEAAQSQGNGVSAEVDATTDDMAEPAVDIAAVAPASEADTQQNAEPASADVAAPETKAKRSRVRKPRAPRKPAAEAPAAEANVTEAPVTEAETDTATEVAASGEVAETQAEKPVRKPARKRTKAVAKAAPGVVEPGPELTPVPEAPAAPPTSPEPAPAAAAPAGQSQEETETQAPRKRGWWSRAVGK